MYNGMNGMNGMGYNPNNTNMGFNPNNGMSYGSNMGSYNPNNSHQVGMYPNNGDMQEQMGMQAMARGDYAGGMMMAEQGAMQRDLEHMGGYMGGMGPYAHNPINQHGYGYDRY